MVFLPHCHSTNEVTKAMAKSGSLSNGSIVITNFQENGRGQQGNVWLSEKDKNLLFTILLKPTNFVPNRQYLLNVMTSIAIQQTLEKYLTKSKIEIKWPNDIYVNEAKIAGILIETTISRNQLESVFCGIGLNVNQGHFSLNSATSMLIESGETFDLDQVLETLLTEMEKVYEVMNNDPKNLLNQYQENLRWFEEERTFMVDSQETQGTIKGIDEQGKLIVDLSGEIRHFALKEIAFLH